MLIVPLLLFMIYVQLKKGAAPFFQTRADKLRALQMNPVEANLREHTRILASDEFDGRFPGSKGEDLTVDYLSSVFGSLNLNTQTQELSLQKITSKSKTPFILSQRGSEITLKDSEEFICHSSSEITIISNMNLVFVGFGIVAKEYQWNDYEGLDVKDKIVVALVNDPGLIDNALFQGLNAQYDFETFLFFLFLQFS